MGQVKHGLFALRVDEQPSVQARCGSRIQAEGVEIRVDAGAGGMAVAAHADGILSITVCRATHAVGHRPSRRDLWSASKVAASATLLLEARAEWPNPTARGACPETISAFSPISLKVLGESNFLICLTGAGRCGLNM